MTVLSIVVFKDLSEFLKFGFNTLNFPLISSSDKAKFVSSVIPLPK